MDKEQYEILFRLEETHWWYQGMQRIVGSLLRKHLKQGLTPRILDAGCGTGGTTKYLSDFGPVVGLDLSGDAVSLAHRRETGSIVQASIESIPLAKESFDLLVSFDVLYHMDVGDDDRALKEFNRVLKPGGLMVIRVPAYDWLRGAHDVAVHTRHRYRKSELGRKIREAGFEVRKLTYVNSLLFPVAASKRLMEKPVHSLGPDLQMPSRLVNSLLQGVLSVEAAAVPFISFPWGLSVLAIAEKPAASKPALLAFEARPAENGHSPSITSRPAARPSERR